MKQLLGFILLFIISLWLFSCNIIKQGKEMKTFADCSFTIKHINVVNIAGIDVQNYKSIEEIPPESYVTLLKKVFSSDLPSVLEIEAEAYNPSTNKAYTSGFDWEIYVQKELFSNGTVPSPVEVLPGKTASFSITTKINLFKIVNSKSLPEILSTIISKRESIKLSDLDLVIKIKPWYHKGSGIKEFPGYITLK